MSVVFETATCSFGHPSRLTRCRTSHARVVKKKESYLALRFAPVVFAAFAFGFLDLAASAKIARSTSRGDTPTFFAFARVTSTSAWSLGMEYICDDVACGRATAMSSSDIMGMDAVAAASTALAVAGPIP